MSYPQLLRPGHFNLQTFSDADNKILYNSYYDFVDCIFSDTENKLLKICITCGTTKGKEVLDFIGKCFSYFCLYCF